MDNVTNFRNLIEASKLDENTHTLTLESPGSLTGAGSTVSLRRQGVGLCFDIATTYRDLEGHEFRRLLPELVEAADACGVTLVTTRPGGQFEMSNLRVWIHQTFGFQDDEDACFLRRLTGGLQDPHWFGGFGLDPVAEQAVIDEIERDMMAGEGPDLCGECVTTY